MRVGHRECHAIFYSVRGFKEQLELTGNLAEIAVKNDELSTRIRKIIDRSRNASEKRNKIVHGSWHLIEEQSPDGQTRIRELVRVAMPSSFHEHTDLFVLRDTIDRNEHAKFQSLRGKRVFTPNDIKKWNDDFLDLADSLFALSYDLRERYLEILESQGS